MLNDERGVLLEVEGPGAAVEAFLERLPREAPPLASVERVTRSVLEPVGEAGFEIRPSPAGRAPDALVSADTATCDDCLRELFDPADRRYRYPFVNCTNCGPRFTIVTGVPYPPTAASTPSPTPAPTAGPRCRPGSSRLSRRCATA